MKEEKTPQTLFLEAFLKVQQALKPVKADSTNPHFKSRYASLQAVHEATLPVLQDNGFVIMQGGVDINGKHYLRTTLSHIGGHMVSFDYPLIQETSNPQHVASSITYGARYSICSLLALSTDDDDANLAASASKPAVTSTVRDVFKPKTTTKQETGTDPVQKGDPDLGSVRCVISGASKPKDFKGKPSYGFVSDGEWYNTSSPEHAEILNEAKGNKMPVIIEFKRYGTGKYIQSVRWVPVENDSKPDPEPAPVMEEVGF